MIWRRLVPLCVGFFLLLGWGTSRAQGPTPLSYFGLVIHLALEGSPWPPFPFGTWRLWDARVTWSDLEPQRGVWRFEKLDRYLALARRFQIEPTLVLANSPRWASARPDEPSGYGPGKAAEPADLEDWRRYVERVTQRYRGQIRYYEVWNEPSDVTHFTGSMQAYLDLVRIAAEVVRANDPQARLVAPSVNGGGRHLLYLDEFLGKGGAQYVDVIGHHFYLFKGHPENLQRAIRDVKAVMLRHRVAELPLWNSEVGWWIADEDGSPDPAMMKRGGGWRKFDARLEGASAVLKTFLISRGEGVDRTIWYAWDNAVGLGMIEATSRKVKPMVVGYEDSVRWLLGKAVQPCRHSGSGVWSCELRTATDEVQYVVWQQGGGAAIWTPPSRTAGWSQQALGSEQRQEIRASGVHLTDVPLLITPN